MSVDITGYANVCSEIDCDRIAAIVELQMWSGGICGCVRVSLSISFSELEKAMMSWL